MLEIHLWEVGSLSRVIKSTGGDEMALRGGKRGRPKEEP